jgi:pyridoxamine 5'-phosphate oxidase
MEDLSAYRKSYEKFELDEHDVPGSPMPLFGTWFADADAARSGEANAMTVTTLDTDGFTHGRVVLLKRFDESGFTFFTNYNSEKGKALAAYPQVGLSFFWQQQERQVIIKGNAEKTSERESAEYFASRPRGSQFGALVSEQSEIVPGRAFLESKMQQLEQQLEGKDVPKPDDWGGYRVVPVSIEFWQGRPNRLHDRIRYTRTTEGNWEIERLSP